MYLQKVKFVYIWTPKIYDFLYESTHLLKISKSGFLEYVYVSNLLKEDMS